MTKTKKQSQATASAAIRIDSDGRHIVPGFGDEGPAAGPRSMPERPNAKRDGEIGRLRSEGWTYRALGMRFGLSASGIQCVLRREEYRKDRPPGLGLSARATHALLNDCLIERSQSVPEMLAAIADHPYSELMKIPNLGQGSILEIAGMLRRHGLVMKGLPSRLVKKLDAL